MENFNLNQFRRLALYLKVVVFCLSTGMVSAQETMGSVPLQPLPGQEITAGILDMQGTSSEHCLLQSDNTLFCWTESSTLFDAGDFRFDYPALNEQLNNNILAFSLGFSGLCAIGVDGGLACANNTGNGFSSDALLNVPEPDADYRFISHMLYSDDICAIQLDDRVVCWGANDVVTNVPTEALYLKHVSLRYQYACGVDLNNSIVCWGEDSFYDSFLEEQFGPDGIPMLSNVRQVEVGPYAACVIKLDGAVECFASLSQYTEQLAGRDIDSLLLSYTGGSSLCYKQSNGAIDCLRQAFGSTDELQFETMLAAGTSPSFLSIDNSISQINSDGSFINYFVGSETSKSLFPTAPTGLTQELYSATATELFWDRATVGFGSSDEVTGYEIYRNDQLIAVTDVVTSFFDGSAANVATASYAVRAIRGVVGGGSASIRGGNGESSTPGTVPSPSNLAGSIYSYTALEIFYDRADAGTTYDISRDGTLVAEGTDAISFFDGALAPATAYTYSVVALRNGERSQPSEIILTTNIGNATELVAAPMIIDVVRYSDSAAELFWARPVSDNLLSYELSRNGTLLSMLDGVSYFDPSAFNDQSYQYSLVAIDAMGNRSQPAEIQLPANP